MSVGSPGYIISVRDITEVKNGFTLPLVRALSASGLGLHCFIERYN